MASREQGLIGSFGLLILRLGIGGFMVSHGWGKLRMLLDGDFERFGDPIGLGNQLSLILVVGAEFLCAVFVMLGLLTRLAAMPVVFAMGVAAFVAHGADPLTMEEGFRLFFAKERPFPVSKEPALLYFIPFLTLVFTGAGRFSLDALIFGRCCGQRGDEPPSGT